MRVLLLCCMSFVALTSAARPRYTNSWAVEIQDGRDAADELARKHGFVNLGQIGNLRGYYHFQLQEEHQTAERSVEGAFNPQTEKTEALQQEENVGFVEQQKIKRQVKKDYSAPTDPQWHNQWSLLNTGQTNGPSGLDLNVEPAWIQGITGRGVVVAFVDDGLEHSHPDLAPNYDHSASWDFAHHDSNPTPDYSADEPNSHGTSCAGEVGMAKDNGHCGVGIAYNCSIGGLKVDFSSSSDATEASALGYSHSYIQVYSNSWGPSDFGFVVSGPGTLVKRTLETGAREGRNGKGSIYVWASGNGGRYYDSCAADGYSSSIYTIAVGSADQRGRQAFYDEDCAGKMAVTFSYNSDTFPTADQTWDPYRQILTTTLNGRCTDDFTGTSASTPLLSGVIALALQANPDLSWRDVQYLIAYTSNPTLLTGGSAGDWTTNGAGLNVSHKFGFGAIDAEAMVTRARRWISVPEQHVYSIRPYVSDSTASRYYPTTVSFTVSSSSFNSNNQIHFLEHVVVQMSLSVHGYSRGYDYSDLYDYIDDYYYQRDNSPDSDPDPDPDSDSRVSDQPLQHLVEEKAGGNQERDIYDWLENAHTRRGDIKIELTSPQGTKSTLLPYRNYDFVNEVGYSNWPFMSVHHWGENPVGTWTLKVSFQSSSGYVQMSNLDVTFYGAATTPGAVSNIPQRCDSACARGCSGTGPQNCDSCRNLRVSSTLECVNECPVGTRLYKRYCISTSTATQEPTTATTATTQPHTDTHTTATSQPHTNTHTTATSQPHTNTHTTATTQPPTHTHTTATTQPHTNTHTTATTQPHTNTHTTATTQPPTHTHTTATTQPHTNTHTTATTQPHTNTHTTATTQPHTNTHTTATAQPHTNTHTTATTQPHTNTHTTATAQPHTNTHTTATAQPHTNTHTTATTQPPTEAHTSELPDTTTADPQIQDDNQDSNENNSNKVAIIAVSTSVPAVVVTVIIVISIIVAVWLYKNKRQRSAFTFIPLEEPSNTNTV